jgi:signal transduction histidine kinase
MDEEEMPNPLAERSHPLPFLLRLEWVLLGITTLVELPTVDFGTVRRYPLLCLIALLVFTLMGLRLPAQRSRYYLFLGAEALLLGLMAWVAGLRLFQAVFLVLVMRNCILFQGVESVIVTAIVLIFYGLMQWHRLLSWVPSMNGLWPRIGLIWFSVMLLFSVMVLFLQLLVNAIWQERQQRQQLAIANQQLRDYALKVEDQATLQERNRIARDIHDSLGHSLTIFNRHLEAALKLWDADPQESKTLLTEAKQVAAQALGEVRQSVQTLRADPLQGRSLSAALQQLATEFCRTTSITPTLHLHLPQALSPSLSTTIYRIVQEALTNSCKHAKATQIDVSIDLQQRASPTLVLTIQDNGIGFDMTQTKTGFGLQGMQERTHSLMGTFELTSAPQTGCQIRATFPLHDSDP